MKKIIAIFILTTCIGFSVFADNINEAYDLLDKKDYRNAMVLLEKLSKQGNARAQVNLGLMYARGQGVTANINEAVKWFNLAAKLGDIGGQYNMAIAYFHGDGITKDYIESIRFFKLAAENKEVPKKFIGLQATAQLYLAATCYAVANDTKDYEQSHKWYYIASMIADAPDIRQQAQQGRSNTAAKMTPEQIERAQHSANDWLKKHQA